MKRIAIITLGIILFFALIGVFYNRSIITNAHIEFGKDYFIEIRIKENLKLFPEYSKTIWVETDWTKSDNIEFISPEIELQIYLFSNENSYYVLLMDGNNYSRVIDVSNRNVIDEEFGFTIEKVFQKRNFGTIIDSYFINEFGDLEKGVLFE